MSFYHKARKIITTTGALLIATMQLADAHTPGHVPGGVFPNWRMFIDANPIWNLRDPNVRVYQAYESITFDIGFESQPGDDFYTEILGSLSFDPAPSNTTGSDNSDMIWVLTKNYDENGAVATESKEFYDKSGRPLQTQNKIKYRKDALTTYTHVVAQQPVKDELGRSVLMSLSAPIDASEFIYKPDFITNSTGSVYDYRNFDRYKTSTGETDKTNNPEAVGGQNTRGTLGWYYGPNNLWEPYAATTDYPYTRQTYYRDGSELTKETAGAGEQFMMGSGHEAKSYIVPVANELDNYLLVRNKFFSTGEVGALPTSLLQEAAQVINADVNGKLNIAIQDKNKKALLSARPGNDLVITNTMTIKPGNISYFRLLAAGNVSLSSAANAFYDMNTNQQLSVGTGGARDAGYYKVVNTGTSDLTVTYSNGYKDLSYAFYNQLGQLVAIIAPEGVKKLLGNGINNYATKSDIPFVSLFEYDTRGHLVKTISPDKGAQEYVYRTDNKIRFSQTAEQKLTGKFSYVNYDSYGRAVETGEYLPDGGGIAFNSDLNAGSNPMRDILDNISATGGLTTGTKFNVVMTQYDVADNVPVSNYLQNAGLLGGAVSVSRKYSSIINNSPVSTDITSSTWYNYDAEGNVLWTVQYIKDLGYKTTDYIYDIVGRLVEKVFQRGIQGETFVHYYEYDPITKNLWKVYTGTSEALADKKLQATYIYYLHGPLKRIELADNLQGIDYTYTLNGALKAINNSNKTMDPGQDGGSGTNAGFNADAFGMVLDYYPGDYRNTRPAGTFQTINGINTTGVGTDSYAGNVKAMTWYSKKPASISGTPGIEDPTSYVYQYDDKYQFTESTWGTGVDFSSTPAGFTTTTYNKEALKDPQTGVPAYDANGNIQYLQRTDGNGALLNMLTYSYNANTNQLQSVVDAAPAVPQTSNYTYDQNGNLKLEETGNAATRKYIQYDAAGRVTAVARNSGFTQKVVEYVYDEGGAKVAKRSYDPLGGLSQVTYYVGNVIYTQAVTGGVPGAIVPQEYAINGGTGRMGIFYRQANIYAYELSDHTGNVRAIVAKSGSTMDVRMYTDYYPYGMVIPNRKYQSPEGYRYGYQGQYSEKEDETDWNAFELRMYDSRIARWFQTDPKGQYSSPYIGMGNDPVNGVDKDGGFWEEFYNWINGYGWMSDEAKLFYFDKASQGYGVHHEWRGSRLKGHANVDWGAEQGGGFIETSKNTFELKDYIMVSGKKFAAKQDFFVSVGNQKYAVYYDLEFKVNFGAQMKIENVFKVNLISYDLMKYDWADDKFVSVFDLDDNMKELKFSSGLGIDVEGMGASVDLEYAPGQDTKIKLGAKFMGANVDVVKKLMMKEADAQVSGYIKGVLKLPDLDEINAVVGVQTKFGLKAVKIPNNDTEAWLAH